MENSLFDPKYRGSRKVYLSESKKPWFKNKPNKKHKDRKLRKNNNIYIILIIMIAIIAIVFYKN